MEWKTSSAMVPVPHWKAERKKLHKEASAPNPTVSKKLVQALTLTEIEKFHKRIEKGNTAWPKFLNE